MPMAASASWGWRHRRRRRSPRRPGPSSTSRRPAWARLRASSRSARCGSRASSRWARSPAWSIPASPCRPAISELTGIRDRDLRDAGPLRPALAELLALARGSMLRRAQRVVRRRHAGPRADAPRRHAHRYAGARHGRRLARRLLAGRIARFDLASVSERFDVTVRPCHRALPDALATGEVLLALIGLAQERGAETAEDVMALALAAPRRARERRRLAAGCRPGPASTSCAIGSGRRSTWARRAICAPACAPISGRGASRPGSRGRSRRSPGSMPRPPAPSSRRRSASST